MISSFVHQFFQSSSCVSSLTHSPTIMEVDKITILETKFIFQSLVFSKSYGRKSRWSFGFLGFGVGESHVFPNLFPRRPSSPFADFGGGIWKNPRRVISHGCRKNHLPFPPPPKKWDVLKKFVLYSLLTISGKWIRLCERISDFYFFESFGKNVIDNSIFVGWFLPKSWLSQFLMVSPSTSIHPWHMEGA